MTTLPLIIRHEHAGDAEAIERLHARAFGPGRFARTAYRLREGTAPVAELCFTALVATYLVGSVRVARPRRAIPFSCSAPSRSIPASRGVASAPP